MGDKLLLLKKQNGKCFYCGVIVHHRGTHEDDYNRDPHWMTTDHKIPWSLGGKTDLENCVIACRSCNSRKGMRVE